MNTVHIVIFPHYSWHILRLLLVSGARTSNWSKSLSRSLLIIVSPRLWVQSPCQVFKSKFSHLFIPLGGSSHAKKQWRSLRFLGCKLTPFTNWSAKQEPQSLGWPVLMLAGRVGHKPAPWPTPACAWRCRTRTMPGSLPCDLTASALQSSTKGPWGLPINHGDPMIFMDIWYIHWTKKNVI